MRRLSVVIALAVTAATAAVSAVPAGAASGSTNREPAGGFAAVPVAEDLAFPSAFDVAPGGVIFYAERFPNDDGVAEIRVLEAGTDSRFVRIHDVVASGERGLLGLALHPRYPDIPFVYAYVTQSVGGQLRNRILRFRERNGRGCCALAIFQSDTISTFNHNGGPIAFGADRMLYAVIGDAENPANSQNLNVDAGKMLRMTSSGGVPGNNPFPGSLVFAYGIRNSFGFTFDPLTGRLWETENGPECNDEINLVLKGRNYAWGPAQDCSDPNPPANTNQDGQNRQLPEAWFGSTIAPTGAAFCDGCGLGAGAEGDLFFGAWNDGDIRQVNLTADRRSIASMSVAFPNPQSILAMKRGPAGSIYFSDPDGIYRLTAG